MRVPGQQQQQQQQPSRAWAGVRGGQPRGWFNTLGRSQAHQSDELSVANCCRLHVVPERLRPGTTAAFVTAAAPAPALVTVGPVVGAVTARSAIVLVEVNAATDISVVLTEAASGARFARTLSLPAHAPRAFSCGLHNADAADKAPDVEGASASTADLDAANGT